MDGCVRYGTHGLVCLCVGCRVCASKFKNDYVVKADKLHFSLVSLIREHNNIVDAWCIHHSALGSHCWASWIVCDRVAVVAATAAPGPTVFAGTFPLFLYSNFHAAGFSCASLPLASCFLPYEILNRIACLPEANTPFVWRTASARGLGQLVRWMHLYSHCLTRETRWPMPCFAKKTTKNTQKEIIIALRDKDNERRTTGERRPTEPQNDWWFNKYMAFFIQPWLFSLQRNNDRRQKKIVTIFQNSIVRRWPGLPLSMSLVVIRPNYIVRVEFNLNM